MITPTNIDAKTLTNILDNLSSKSARQNFCLAAIENDKLNPKDFPKKYGKELLELNICRSDDYFRLKTKEDKNTCKQLRFIAAYASHVKDFNKAGKALCQLHLGSEPKYDFTADRPGVTLEHDYMPIIVENLRKAGKDKSAEKVIDNYVKDAYEIRLRRNEHFPLLNPRVIEAIYRAVRVNKLDIAKKIASKYIESTTDSELVNSIQRLSSFDHNPEYNYEYHIGNKALAQAYEQLGNLSRLVGLDSNKSTALYARSMDYFEKSSEYLDAARIAEVRLKDYRKTAFYWKLERLAGITDKDNTRGN